MRGTWWYTGRTQMVMVLVAALVAPLACFGAEHGTAHAGSQSDELEIFGFENGTDEFAIPDWAMTSPDYVGKSAKQSLEMQSHGNGSLEIDADFPGTKWSGAYVDRLIYVTDWSAFGGLAADVYVPANAPKGLKARFIIGIGDKWEWTEMNRALPLEPGQWTPLVANLKPGSMDWKFFPDESFRKDVRKLGIRIEADKGVTYTGPVYIDSVRLQK